MGLDDAAVANFGRSVDDGVRTDTHARTKAGGGVHDGGGMDVARAQSSPASLKEK